jgi:60 kDa SS-A/Ro ribonucleoprotein
MVNTYLNTNERQTKNNAGGQVYTVGDMQRLERFLILGTVGGTYYVNERELTKENLDTVARIIEAHGKAAVDKIVEIGTSNRAPKHDPVLVAYAIAVSSKNPETRQYALGFFNDVIRIGTHLFHFIAYVDTRRGWGRALRRAVANWYLARSDVSLANQLVKYKQRDGWSHRDLLRLSHPQADSSTKNLLLRYAVQGELLADDSAAHAFVAAAEEATHSDDLNRVVDLVQQYKLPREVVNTKFQNTPELWEALAPTMGYTALLRNLRNMAGSGYLTQGSDAVVTIRERLLNTDAMRGARVHPFHVFMAQRMATNVPAPIQTALEDAFFASFAVVKPTNKRIQLALDVSSSMMAGAIRTGRGEVVANAREVAALMAMVTARTEPYAEFVAFSHALVPIDITPRDSLNEVMNKMAHLSFGATDCSLPMYAARQRHPKTKKTKQFDAFAVYTDSETWTTGTVSRLGYYGYSRTASSGDPAHELREYRKASGVHDAKLVVVAATSTDFTIADPNDANMLDVVGFDASAPAIIADFIRG